MLNDTPDLYEIFWESEDVWALLRWPTIEGFM